MELNFCIAGGRGFIGKILRKCLANYKCRVLILTRKPEFFTPFSNNEFSLYWDGVFLESKIFEDLDVFVNLSGETISGRLTNFRKDLIYKSRILSTKAIVDAIINSKKLPKYFFQASAIGIYKESKEFIYEDSAYGNDFLADLVKSWENEALFLKNLPLKLFILRFGLILGREGGIYNKLNKYFKNGLGVIPGFGNYFLSWLYEKDLAEAFIFLLKNGKGGIYNFTSPNPVKGKKFFKAWASSYGKPVFFFIPFIFLQLAYGKEIKDVLGKSLKVYPKALIDEGFNFKFSEIKDTFRDLKGNGA